MSFTPYDIEFESPVEISIAGSKLSRSNNNKYLCYLENTNDTNWKIISNAICNNGTCVANIYNFGIFSTCIIKKDCNGDLGGYAYLDDCNNCIGGNTGNDVFNYNIDECGICNGIGKIDWFPDFDNDGLGDQFSNGVNECFNIGMVNYAPNNLDFDDNCSSNIHDECGICDGNNEPNTGICDCKGEPNGNLNYDDCGVCGGDGTTCMSISNNLSPYSFGIYDIYPNPFNPITNITYGILKYSKVQITIFDLSGKQIYTLVNGYKKPGFYQVTWNANKLSSGLYILNFVAGEFRNNKKLILIK